MEINKQIENRHRGVNKTQLKIKLIKFLQKVPPLGFVYSAFEASQRQLFVVKFLRLRIYQFGNSKHATCLK